MSDVLPRRYFGWRSIALHARWSTSIIRSSAVSPLGGECATRVPSRSDHSAMADKNVMATNVLSVNSRPMRRQANQ